MENLLQDIRYGIRMLAKRPGFTSVAIIALALGIGANTAVFSVINAILLRPLPFKDPERLVWVWGASINTGQGQRSVSPPDFLDFREQVESFESFSAMQNWSASLTGGGEPERITSARVSAGFFETLGVAPAYGRTFTLDEERSGNDQVVIIGHGLWQRRFASNPSIIGESVMLNDKSYTIVGVMPADFKFPRDVELWAPITFHIPQTSVRRFHFLRPIARLKDGVSVEQAHAEMTSIARQLEQAYPDSNTDYGTRLVVLPEQIVGDMRPTLLMLLAAVAFVLLIACANVANLLLARAATRQKEIALRSALGASRFRVIRQLLTESVLLSIIGGALGLLIAYWGIEALVSLSPANIPRVKEVSIDGRVLGFTLFASVVTGIIFGLVPALQASHTNLSETLKEGGRSAGGGGRHRVRALLVVSEVALALVLLIGAGLMLRSFSRLSQVDPGFKPDNVLATQFSLTQAKYPKEEQRLTFLRQLVERVGSLAGVQAVGLVSELPMSGQNNDTRFKIEGRPKPPDSEGWNYANFRGASPDYFRALGIPLVKGRYFEEQDRPGATNAIIISESFARDFFADEEPIGQHLTIDMGEPVTGQIVGVVGTIRHQGIMANPWREMYLSYFQLPGSGGNLVVKAAADPAKLTAAIKNEVQSLDKDLPLYNTRTMEQLVSDSVAQPRFRTLLLGIFALVALVLAAVGIYGVMSYYVTQRTHEIGVRMALGAQASDVLKLVVKQGMWLALAGVGAGLIIAFFLTRVISSLLFGIGPTDPATFAAIALLLIAVALLASYIPARRATKVDPMIALRYE